MTEEEVFTPSSSDEYLATKTTQYLGKVLQEQQDTAESQKKKVTTVKATFKRNVGYDPKDIFFEDKRRKVEKAKERKEKDLAKKQKDDERKRKKEHKEEKKEQRKKQRQEERVEKEKRLEKVVEKRKALECKANCGRVCRTGPDWVGCEYCDMFWVCPICYGTPSVKGKLTKHERWCAKQK